MSRVKEVMTPNVQVILPDWLVHHAALKMKEMDVGALPVSDGDRLIGFVTDRDITVRMAAAGHDPCKTRVYEVMSSPVIYCYEDQDVEDAARIMEVQKVRRLIVLDRHKRLVGIVSVGDIAAKTGREALVGEILEHISNGDHEFDRHEIMTAGVNASS